MHGNKVHLHHVLLLQAQVLAHAVQNVIQLHRLLSAAAVPAKAHAFHLAVQVIAAGALRLGQHERHGLQACDLTTQAGDARA